jgi:hypothetical protein
MATLLAPRPLPDRRVAVVAGGALVALALPVFLVAGWRVEGWTLGAGLWLASQLAGIVLNRAGIGEPTLRGSGVVAFGMMTRGIVLMLGLLAIAVVDSRLALAGALVYAAAYTLELALSLTLYFGGERRA